MHYELSLKMQHYTIKKNKTLKLLYVSDADTFMIIKICKHGNNAEVMNLKSCTYNILKESLMFKQKNRLL